MPKYAEPRLTVPRLIAVEGGVVLVVGPMTTPDSAGGLLAGVRIIESSMLGPGAVTMQLADLGAEVIKVENPGGDYVRKMTLPIVDGISLLHRHLNRGKRSIVLDLRTPEGVATYLDLVRGADAVIEAMRPGGLARRGLGFDDAARGQPADRVLHHLGLRHDRPLQGHAEPRHRVRRVGRRRAADDQRGRLPDHPVVHRHRHQRRPAVRRARHLRRHHPRARDRRAAAGSRSRRATPRRRSTGTASRATRPTSGPRTRSPATTATARARAARSATTA